MTFTALHRAVGAEPGPLTEDLLDQAVRAGVEETTDLDWKTRLPDSSKLRDSDFFKDAAAMANAGGGVIVFGVTESEKAANGRADAGEFSENYERTLRAVAMRAITPPVFGLKIHQFGREPRRAVVVEVPASIDGPHLIFNNQFFGAPVRDDADTTWMDERRLEAMYRARFDERRKATEVTDRLYDESARGRDTAHRAWLVAVAHPRRPLSHLAVDREHASTAFNDALAMGKQYTEQDGIHPLESVERHNLRPGLRRWVARNTATEKRERWKESWATLHHDGSVTLATSVGGHPFAASETHPGSHIEAQGMECGVADFMALVRATAQLTGNGDYDLRVGVEWDGNEPLTILTHDGFGFTAEFSTPIHGFTPVEVSVDAEGPDSAFIASVYALAQDCVNQGGISNLQMIVKPPGDMET